MFLYFSDNMALCLFAAALKTNYAKVNYHKYSEIKSGKDRRASVHRRSANDGLVEAVSPCKGQDLVRIWPKMGLIPLTIIINALIIIKPFYYLLHYCVTKRRWTCAESGEALKEDESNTKEVTYVIVCMIRENQL